MLFEDLMEDHPGRRLEFCEQIMDFRWRCVCPTGDTYATNLSILEKDPHWIRMTHTVVHKKNLGRDNW